jgi:hypothetical protein
MLFNLDQTLRSLTTSPMSTAVDQAHRMAQRRLEAGGPAVSARGQVDDGIDAGDFVLPPDIDPADVAMAIEAKLRGHGGSAHERDNNTLPVLAVRSDRRMAVLAEIIRRLGDGAVDRGQRVLHRIIANIRGHRVLGRNRSCVPAVPAPD